jgi:hypothetical protein
MVRLVQTSVVLTCSAFLLLAGNLLAQPSGMPAQTPAAAAVSGTAAQSNQHHSAKRRTKEPEQPVAQTPPRTLTPEEMAPVAPTVSYQAGQLTIESKNATLAQVLKSVQAKTGGAFDIPASANNDRVVAQLGPGQPKDILASLLNGSKFNYIILGVPNDPGAVQKLILTPRTKAPITNTAQNEPVRQPPPEPQEEDYSAPEPPAPEAMPGEENTAVEDQQNQPSPIPYQPGFPGQQPQTGTNGQPQQGVKTPEQLLQELQRLQQQQQMYQQQLNPANRNLQQNYKPPDQE